MLTVSIILRNLGFMLYGGPLIAFTILLLSRTLSGLPPQTIVRVYRAWGPGLGLALGMCIVGLLSNEWFIYGEFSWGGNNPAGKLHLISWASFFGLWLSNLKLEVWTLEPLRKLDKDGTIVDGAAYESSTTTLVRHMSVHSTLIILTACLFMVMESAS